MDRSSASNAAWEVLPDTGSDSPASSSSSTPVQSSPSPPSLAPLPRCTEHPREELKIFCKACAVPICSTCVDTDHRECQQRWDRDHINETPRNIVFEGIEKAARRLKQDVLGGLSARSLSTEQQLRQAARAVADRTDQVDQQLQQRIQAVEQARDRLVRAVTERCEGLIGALHEAAVGKGAVLATQQQGLEGGASALQQAREAAGACLESLDVDERPVEVVRACLRLVEQLESGLKASQAEEPVTEADLEVELEGLVRLEEEVKGAGWAGAMEPDPSKCVVSVVEPAERGKVVVPGGVVKLRLTLRSTDGGPARTHAGGVAVYEQQCGRGGEAVSVVKPDSLWVKEQDGGRAFVIGCSIKGEGIDDVTLGGVGRLCVQVKGREVQGSPVVIPVFNNRILTTVTHIAALRSFLGGRNLRFCYRASEDGWHATDFHYCCNSQGSTVVVMKEQQHGYIFGGFTSVPWASQNTDHPDPSAFLFSIVNPAGTPPVKLASRKEHGYSQSVVNHVKKKGPSFGLTDLAISDSPNIRASTSSLQCAFRPPTGQNQYFLAGSNSFLLSEFEVFVVT